MSSQASFGSGMLFQTITDDLSATMATADELSREFNTLLMEASTGSAGAKPQTSRPGSGAAFPRDAARSGGSSSSSSNGSSSSAPFSPGSARTLEAVLLSSKNQPASPVFSTSPLSSPKPLRAAHSTLPRAGPDSHPYVQRSPAHSPSSPRRSSPGRYDRSPRGSVSYAERIPSPSPTAAPFEHSPRFASSSPNLLTPYDSSTMGRRSPRRERSPSPLAFNYPRSSTPPRNMAGFRQPDEGAQRQKSPGKWNETDLDTSYERKPHRTYDKTEWLRPSVPNSGWRESNLDGPPPAPSPKKSPRAPPHPSSYSSLPRNARISVPPDVTSPAHYPYHPQPIISRISIPPASAQSRQRRPIPLSVIMRLQNPHWGAMATQHHHHHPHQHQYPGIMGAEEDAAAYPPAASFPRDFFHQAALQPRQHPPELRQPAIYSDALNPGDIDAELERLDFAHHAPTAAAAAGNPGMPEGSGEAELAAPRPLSPTRLQPVVAPEAQIEVMPDLEELLRIRAEIPRALKRRGSVDQSRPLKKASHYQPNQYKNLINKLFHRKDRRQRGEQGSETSSSSDGEDSPAGPVAPPQTSTPIPDHRNYHSILRQRRRDHRASSRRARLSPLVLLLDGALVGELETVQRAVQEMSDPSQPNDEGITALHNAICGGHYNVVEFLVCIGANVSAPDSHGWTPLHCAASCNDRPLCEFLVRNGAAVMAMTESDGASASQKCDPYAVGYEECESFMRGVEEAMGVENSGVLYALWSYPAQAPDELSFKEGDMVTILQKPEGSDWWWASLCGREGFVPSNYFGLFPKVRPKSLC